MKPCASLGDRKGPPPPPPPLYHSSTPTEPWPGVPERLSVPGDQTEGVIHELTPATAYHLRVTAQNTLGLGTPSEVIQAATDEEGE